ncbi:MAG TPA: hypothetical protein VF614_18400 [Chthoniobacteraceae bacterium]|jgi:hypothetical protein
MITTTVFALCVITAVVFALRGKPAATQPQSRSAPPPSDSSALNTAAISPSPTPPSQRPESSASADLTLRPELELEQSSLPAEARLAAILENRSLTNEAKARYLLATLGSIPDEALLFTAEAALQRLPDKAYQAALPHLLNPQTHGQVLSVLFNDLLERPDAVTLPALADVAANADHPFAESARDNLRLLLGTEPSSDRLAVQAQIRDAISAERKPEP